jgi:hypothetical protein
MAQVLDKSGFRLGAGERLFDAGEPHSLDDVVSKLARGLTVRGNAACIVCGATFVRAPGTESPGSAECSSCGSRFE